MSRAIVIKGRLIGPQKVALPQNSWVSFTKLEDQTRTSARARQKGPPHPPSPSRRPQQSGEGRREGEGGRGSQQIFVVF